MISHSRVKIKKKNGGCLPIPVVGKLLDCQFKYIRITRWGLWSAHSSSSLTSLSLSLLGHGSQGLWWASPQGSPHPLLTQEPSSPLPAPWHINPVQVTKPTLNSLLEAQSGETSHLAPWIKTTRAMDHQLTPSQNRSPLLLGVCCAQLQLFLVTHKHTQTPRQQCHMLRPSSIRPSITPRLDIAWAAPRGPLLSVPQTSYNNPAGAAGNCKHCSLHSCFSCLNHIVLARNGTKRPQ